MATVEKTPVILEKSPSGIQKLDLKSLPIPTSFIIQQQVLLFMQPLQVGGNHRHSHSEIFLPLSDHLELHWIDHKQDKHIEKMKEGNQLFLFIVPPSVPHAIVNTSKEAPAMLLELVDAKMYIDVQVCEVLTLKD